MNPQEFKNMMGLIRQTIMFKAGGESSLVFFSSLAMHLPCYQTEHETAYTDGKGLYFNTNWMQGLSNRQKVFVFMHELFHVALKHLNRKGSRDPIIWNIACDYSINYMLCRMGLKMPDVAVYDEKYARMSPEEIYELLVKDAEKIPPLAWEDCTGKPLENYEEQELNEKLIQAKEQAKNMGLKAGSLPGELQRFFDELENPKLPWRLILSRWLHAKVNGKYDWKRPSRRLQIKNICMPSRSQEGLERLDFVIDVSGSITNELFVQFLSEIEGVIRELKPRELAVSQFDHTYLGTDVLTRFDSVKGIIIKGGGGTQIATTFEALNKTNSKAILIFTDGYIADLEQANSEKPVIWLVYSNDNFTPPFGKVVPIEIN